MSEVQVARFSDLKSQGARFAAEMEVPLAAYQKMTAEEFFLLMSSPELGGPFATDPGISDPQGLVAAIVKCSPGQGPYLHAHYNTLENFVCLDGRFRIIWGDQGENEIVLDPLDMVSVPRGVVRAFANASDGPAHILAFIHGERPEDFADVSMTPAAADDLDESFGPETAERIKQIGWRFDAGQETATEQVSPSAMEQRIARFARLDGVSAEAATSYALMSTECADAAVAGEPGLEVSILKLETGDAADLGASAGKRTFIGLGGHATFATEGRSHDLGRWDIMTCPPALETTVSNSGGESLRLLVLETAV